MNKPIVRVSILTISDRSYRGEREDLSGSALVEAVQKLGWEIVKTGLVPDEKEKIANWLIEECDSENTDLILTTGGTGFAPRDITPEATREIIEREAPGIAEAMRLKSLQITAHAMLSRAIAGIRKRTLIINLPGSPKAAIENLQSVAMVIPHAVELLHESPSAEAGHQFST